MRTNLDPGKKVLLVGDLHGRTQWLKKLVDEQDQLVIQLGDLGFAQDYKYLADVSSGKLLVVGGNHDEYPDIVNYPWYLGNFGLIPGFAKTFFCRGAYSVDLVDRTPGYDWWPEGELSLDGLDAFLTEYERVKPRVMLTHDCPSDILHELFGYGNIIRTRTAQAFNEAIKIHQPEFWFFGHHHKSANRLIGNTVFQCLTIGEVKEATIF